MIEDLIASTMVFSAVSAAGILQTLPATPHEVARVLGLNEQIVRRCLQLLEAAGALKVNMDGSFEVDSLTADQELADAVDLWSTVGAALQHDRQTWINDDLDVRDSRYEQLLESFDEKYEAAARELARRMMLRGEGRILDIGAGSGVWGRAFLADGANRLTMVDLPKVVEAGRQITEAKGYAASVHAIPGDFLTVPLPDADVVLLANVLRILPEYDAATLVKRACLVSTGVVVIVDVDDYQAQGPVNEAAYRLHVSLRSETCGPYSRKWMLEELKLRGFSRYEIFNLNYGPLRERVIVARRP